MGLGQNGVVLSVFESKRRRIGFTIFCLKFSLFQNDVVLALSKKIKSKMKRRRFVSGRNETTSFHMTVSPGNGGGGGGGGVE